MVNPEISVVIAVFYERGGLSQLHQVMVAIQILIFGLPGEMIAAAAYRRSQVEKLIRRVHRHKKKSK